MYGTQLNVQDPLEVLKLGAKIITGFLLFKRFTFLRNTSCNTLSGSVLLL